MLLPILVFHRVGLLSLVDGYLDEEASAREPPGGLTACIG
jgi:hypothetical protein